MSQPSYRAVIVGLTGIGAARPPEDGSIPLYGRMPNSHASAYHQHPRTRLTAICDLRPERLQECRARWQDVWPDLRLYTDFRKMLATEKPDLVSVATSDHAHADITLAAVEGGARAILCEKPIATTLADADRMIDAARTRNVLLSVEHTRRWDPAYLKTRQILRSGELGELRTMVVEMFSPRAMLFRNGTHMVDLLNFFADTDPQWVMAELEEGFDHSTEYQGDGGRDPATDPAASAYIRYAGGIRAFYNAYKTEFPGSQLLLTCEQGRIEISDRQARLIRGASHYEWTASPIIPDSYLYERQLGAVAELVDVLENGGELISPGPEARKTLEIILAMLRSHQEGNARINLPL